MKNENMEVIVAALDRSLIRETARISEYIDKLQSPSDEFFAKLDERFNKIKDGVKKQTSFKKIIVAVIAATLAFALLACASVAYKEEIKDFFIEIFDNHSKLTDKNVTDVVLSNVSVSYIPSGFIESNKKIDSVSVMYEWKKDSASIFFRARAQGNTILNIDTENSSYTTIQINDMVIHRTEKYDQIDARWTDGEIVYILTSSGLEWEEMVRIIEGVAYQDANG
jgi:uncharacterized lipoprotein YehR (DUF1307 family)